MAATSAGCPAASPRASRSARRSRTSTNTRPAWCRWPGCRRRPAPAPAAARPAPPPAPPRPARPDRRSGSPRTRRDLGVQHRDLHRLAAAASAALWLVISTRPFPAGGKNRCTDARSGTLSNTSSHSAGNAASTPCTDATGSRASPPPGPPAGRPAGRTPPAALRVLGRELPASPDLGQVPVRVLHRHTRLARAPQPVQRHHPRPALRAAAQPGIQPASSSSRPASSHRPRRQRHRQLRRLRPPLVYQRADTHRARGQRTPPRGPVLRSRVRLRLRRTRRRRARADTSP